MTSRQRLLLIVASIVIAALAAGLWLDSFEVSGGEVATLFARLRWWTLLPLFACLAGHVALASWRWSHIDRALGGSPGSFGHAFAFGTLGVALGTFLPPPLMNVASRGLANRLVGGSSMRGALSGSMDQAADFAVVLLMAVPSAIGLMSGDLALFGALVLAATLVGFAAILLWPHLCKAIPAVRDRLENHATSSRFLLLLYGISLLRLVNLTAMTLLILVASQAGNAIAIIIGVPMITLAISLAMLPGAIGISEWSFSAVFDRFDVSQHDVVIFVLANRILLTGLSIGLAVVTLAAAVLIAKTSTSAKGAQGR